MISLVLHGGAGTIPQGSLTAEQEQRYKVALQEALKAGYDILERGGTAMDAVTASVASLEDCPLFNAGKGSVFNNAGQHEMDASIMRGEDRGAGAVCGVQGVRNPVKLARLVMEKSEHVILAGKGAEEFGKNEGVAFEEPWYFHNDFRYQQWQEALQSDRVQLDHAAGGERKFGTVGAAALDQHGNLAAATSTGGMTNKKWGRVGDTPIPGAGTWADNASCAISCTGHGEFFIRTVVAHEVHALMLHKGLSLQEACEQVVMQDLVKTGGEGGLVAVDRKGNISLPFNSEGMYRAWKTGAGEEGVAIYR
jgi:beta-aspartyl-peptidase (threonine type)